VDYQATDSFKTKMKLLISKRWHVGLLLVVVLVAAGYWFNDLKNAQASNSAPKVSGIPDQLVAKDTPFMDVQLDGYVADSDDPDGDLTWTATGGEKIHVTINNSKTVLHGTLTVEFVSKWTGAEIITLRATDPSGAYGEQAVTFSIGTPVVKNIPDESITTNEKSFNLADLGQYVADPDTNVGDLVWTASGNRNFTVEITGAAVTITHDNSIGSETITFTATDPEGNYGSDSATFTLTAAPLPPVVSGIPDQTVNPATLFETINLDSYVIDEDTPDDELTWTVSGNEDLTVDIVVDGTGEIKLTRAEITYPSKWTGSETVTFTATDKEANTGSDSATFTVATVTYAPVVSDIPNQTVKTTDDFSLITLDSYVTDEDTSAKNITWTASGQKDCTVTINADARTALVECPSDWTGAETINFKATDPEANTNADSAVFTVEASNGKAPDTSATPAEASPAATNSGSPLPSVAFSRPTNFPVTEKIVAAPLSDSKVAVNQKDQIAAEVKQEVAKEVSAVALKQAVASSGNPTIAKMAQVLSGTAAIEPEKSEIPAPLIVDVQQLDSLPLVEQPKNGRANSEAVVVQERLKSYGFISNQVPAVASFDPSTQAAVQDFQSAVGINPLGIVGPRTTKALNGQEFISNVTYVFASIIKQGERGEEVRQLQTRLRDQGFFPYDVPSTGWYGPITRVAVETFQKVYALPITGLVDEATRALLNVFSRSS
jgi:peptidoglycan hydrolase-like protein with peptidoglycan-binding domain